MPAQASGQHCLFHIPPKADQILRRMAMTHAMDVLLDDRAGIKLLGDIVTGGTNQLYATGKGLMVRACSNKRGQEAVMNIDYPTGISLTQVWRQYLHIAGQHHDISFQRLYLTLHFTESGFLGPGQYPHLYNRHVIP